MESKTILDMLSCDEEKALYEAGRLDELKTALRKRRCSLIEEMHESQRKVDRLDTVIRQTEKEMKERNEK
ncbi:MAG: hypothetical protein IJR55_03515 [Clostridia bacterium]|nr:hypothetical protein [Clostridia bacterium]